MSTPQPPSAEPELEAAVDIHDGAEAICIAAGHMGVQEHLAPCVGCVIRAYSAALTDARRAALEEAARACESLAFNWTRDAGGTAAAGEGSTGSIEAAEALDAQAYGAKACSRIIRHRLAAQQGEQDK